MTNYRHDRSKVDANQAKIVKALRQIPDVSVQTGHDDIIVGFRGKTRWYEIKTPSEVSKRTGKVFPNKIKPSQKVLLATWQGHYRIVWKIEQILDDLGIKV